MARMSGRKLAAALLSLLGTGLLVTAASFPDPSRLPEAARAAYPGPLLGLFLPAGLSPSWVAGVFVSGAVLSGAGYFLALRTPGWKPWEAFSGAAFLGLLPFLSFPLLSLDVFSYAAYGRLLACHGVNPYLYGPAAVRDPVLPWVSGYWVRMPSLYGPLFTLASGLLSLPCGASPVALAFRFKALAYLTFLASLFLLARLAGRLRPGADGAALVFVGWNPLVLLEGVGGGHNDLLVAVALLAFLLAEGKGRRGLALLALFLAAGVKYVALLGVPIYLAYLGVKEGWGRALRASAPGVPALFLFGLAHLPFLAGGRGIGGFSLLPRLWNAWSAQGLAMAVMGEAVRAGSMGGELVLEAGRVLRGASALVGVAALILVVRAVRWGVPLHRVLAAALLAFLLASPYVLPWYYLWVLFPGAASLAAGERRLAAGLCMGALFLRGPYWTPSLVGAWERIGALLGSNPYPALTLAFLAALSLPLLVPLLSLVRWGER